MSLDLYQRETAERLASLKPILVPEDQMHSLTYIVGAGVGASLLFFPLAYLALSNQFKFKFSNAKIVMLFGVAAFLVGTLNLLIEALIGRNNLYGYMDIFTALILPLIVSGVVIFVAYKKI